MLRAPDGLIAKGLRLWLAVNTPPQQGYNEPLLALSRRTRSTSHTSVLAGCGRCRNQASFHR